MKKKRIFLPRVFTNNFIPTNKSEIGTPDILRAHPHISNFAPKFNGLRWVYTESFFEHVSQRVTRTLARQHLLLW